jgi:phosphoribosylamine---glycine ligase
VVLARLITPLAGLLNAAATGRLEEVPALRWRDEAAVTVVLAADGYPSTPRTGDPISGLVEAGETAGAWVLHAGTRRSESGEVLSAGGRVLSVVGTGPDLQAARGCAYAAVARIGLAGSQFRTDIAERAAVGTVGVPG